MEQNTKERKQYIDVIRAFSVCLIFMYHFSGYIKNLGCSWNIFYEYRNGTWGNIGVFLFFMISGNVLMNKYRDGIELKEYFMNRFRRIFPTFWICYAGAFLYQFWQTKTFPDIPLYKFVLTILGMDGFFAYKTQTFYILGEWFLGSILFIYLLFPIIRLAVKKNIHITVGILFLLNCLLYYNNCFGIFEIAVRRNLLVGLFYFVLGIWIEKIILQIRTHWYGKLIFAVLGAMGILILLVKLPISEYVGYLVLVMGIYLLFMETGKFICKGKAIYEGILFFSKNSYIIFLVHHVIIQNVTGHFAGNLYSFKGTFCIWLICVFLTGLCIALIHKLMRKKQK